MTMAKSGMPSLLKDLRAIQARDTKRALDGYFTAAAILLSTWLIFFLWPTAGAFAGTHALKYALLVSLLSLGFLAAGTVPVNKTTLLWLGWALLSGVISALSYTVFMHEISFGDATYVARPFFFVLALALSYVVGRSARSTSTLTRGLQPLVALMLLLQAAVALTQMAGLGVLDGVYSADKVSPFGGLLRVTGTFGNPNILAHHVLFAVTFLAGHASSHRRAFAWLAFGFLLVLMSGSRTVLLLYGPAALILVHMRSRESFVVLLKLMIPVMLTLLIGSYLVFVLFSEYFPYIAQLISLFGAGEILGFRAFSLRIEHWTNVMARIMSGDLGTWLFGSYDGRLYSGAIDNDWLFALWRQGLLGLVAVLAWYVLALYSGSRISCRTTRSLSYLWILMIFMFSIMFESVSGWVTPFVIMVVFGLYLGASNARPGSHFDPGSSSDSKASEQSLGGHSRHPPS